MIKETHIADYTNSLNVKIPSLDKFFRLSEIFKINPIREKIYSTPNYERGALLYALITKHRPKIVLEIGTAEGYSAMCMAWAMNDNNIDGKIITVDPKPFSIPVKRLMDFDENKTNEFIMMSTKDLWNKYADPNWLKHISVMSCFSYELLKKELPRIDFCYIDGHHRVKAVLCDFNIFIQNASKNFLCLFDDYYLPNSETKEALELEVAPYFNMLLLKTDFKKQNEKLGREAKELCMCLIDSSDLITPIDDVYSKKHSTKMITNYKNLMKRFLLKKKLYSILRMSS